MDGEWMVMAGFGDDVSSHERILCVGSVKAFCIGSVVGFRGYLGLWEYSSARDYTAVSSGRATVFVLDAEPWTRCSRPPPSHCQRTKERGENWLEVGASNGRRQ